MGRTFWGVQFTWVVRDALFLDVCGDFLRLCERSNPFVTVKFLVVESVSSRT